MNKDFALSQYGHCVFEIIVTIPSFKISFADYGVAINNFNNL